jgi:hypothetical protein
MAENQWSDESPESGEPRRRPSSDHWEGEAPPKAGMSGGMKAFLILAGILGLCCVLCCGVVGFFAYSFFPKVSQVPADVDAARNEIAKIELPAGFAPATMFKIDSFMMSMTAVEYRNAAIHGQITLVEMQLKVSPPAQRDQTMRQQLDRQGFGTPMILNNAKSETKKIKIKGQDCEFVFKQGSQGTPKRDVRQITGVFEGNHGPVSIMIEMDASAYKEDAIIKMLEGIK